MGNFTHDASDRLAGIVLATGEAPLFRAGEAVRVMTRSPVGHYRVPTYLRMVECDRARRHRQRGGSLRPQCRVEATDGRAACEELGISFYDNTQLIVLENTAKVQCAG
jgi:hypothetical protein